MMDSAKIFTISAKVGFGFLCDYNARHENQNSWNRFRRQISDRLSQDAPHQAVAGGLFLPRDQHVQPKRRC